MRNSYVHAIFIFIYIFNPSFLLKARSMKMEFKKSFNDIEQN